MLDKLVDFLISILGLLKCWLVVEPNEKAGIVLLGKYRRVVGPGFWWVVPFNADWYQTAATTWQYHELTLQNTFTADGQQASFTLVMKYRISSLRKYLWEYDDAPDAVRAAARRVAADVVSSNPASALVSREVDAVVLGRLRHEARKMGMTVAELSMVDRTLCPTLRLIQG